MHITAIITEYNPFHNGHLYQIEQIKKRHPEGKIIIVMSGNFAQRGIPCITDKYTRSEMALMSGVDLVLELPVVYATSSAEHFAMAAVGILHKSGIVDELCFGSETPHIEAMQLLADLLLHEPESVSSHIKHSLSDGISYPQARMEALIKYVRDTQKTISISSEVLIDLLSQPNNILGLEYLKALKYYHSSIKPFALQRKTAHYHAIDVEGPIASATAIRHHITSQSTHKIERAMPSSAFELLKPVIGKPVMLDMASSLFHYKMIMSELEDLYAIWDVPKNLCHSLYHNAVTFKNLSDIIDRATSKTYTRATVQRSIIHLLLDIKEKDILAYKQLDYIPYIRLLACKQSARDVLSKLTKLSQVPIIINPAKAQSVLDTASQSLLNYELKASKLYALLAHDPNLVFKDFTYQPFRK